MFLAGGLPQKSLVHPTTETRKPLLSPCRRRPRRKGAPPPCSQTRNLQDGGDKFRKKFLRKKQTTSQEKSIHARRPARCAIKATAREYIRMARRTRWLFKCKQNRRGHEPDCRQEELGTYDRRKTPRQQHCGERWVWRWGVSEQCGRVLACVQLGKRISRDILCWVYISRKGSVQQGGKR
jgi:hypothetical protein